MFHHDTQHTGNYNFNIVEQLPQSKIVSHGENPVNGNLIIKIQKKAEGEWQNYLIPVNQEITVPANDLIKLDALFNPLDISISEKGKYRIHAEFLGKSASWEFDVV